MIDAQTALVEPCDSRGRGISAGGAVDCCHGPRRDLGGARDGLAHAPDRTESRKPVVISEFESVTWLGDILIWITGETELETVRLTDDRMVNKHYDLTTLDDLEVLLDELVALLVDDRIPAAAVVARHPGTPT